MQLESLGIYSLNRIIKVNFLQTLMCAIVFSFSLGVHVHQQQTQSSVEAHCRRALSKNENLGLIPRGDKGNLTNAQGDCILTEGTQKQEQAGDRQPGVVSCKQQLKGV